MSEGTLLPLTREVQRVIASAHLRPDLFNCRVERKFQLWLTDEIRKAIGHDFKVVGEARVGGMGGGVQPVRLWCCGSWPDITVGTADSPLQLAIELKCLWKRGLPNRVAHALGQALLYLERSVGGYRNALVVFFVSEAIHFRIPSELEARLANHEIAVSVVDTTQGAEGA